ncbi:M23 family metallopeptidase [Streptomyces sp. O3]
MASNRPAPEVSYLPDDGYEPGSLALEEPVGEWNPTEESIRPVRGRHRVAKQRGGFARSSTVLGVGVIAAVGAGGIATAQDKSAAPISMPDLSGVTDKLPDVGSLLSDDGDESESESAAELGGVATVSQATAGAEADGEQGSVDAGEALRARIVQQAERKQDQAATAEQVAAADAAAKKAAEDAAKARSDAEAEAEKKRKAEEEAKRKAEEEKKRKAEEEAKRKAEEERLAKLAASFSLPTSSYTITSTYGQAGPMWSSGYHTGLDFAAPTGTPIKAVHSGTVKFAGWHGSAYGYRTVLELDDGTEVSYSHQSSIAVTAGQKVTTGEVIGRVGSTGNSSGPHLHLEVESPGGGKVDPRAWLRSKGLNP